MSYTIMAGGKQSVLFLLLLSFIPPYMFVTGQLMQW